MRGASVVMLLLSLTGARAEPVAVLVRVGLRDAQPTAWAGSASVEPGRLVAAEGWLFDQDDAVQPDGTWRLTTDAVPGRAPAVRPNGLLLTLDAPPDATLTVTANGRIFAARLRDLSWSAPTVGLDGTVSASPAPVYTTLQDTAREDDYPAACTLPDGELVAVWQSWSEAEASDRLFLARCREGVWAAPGEVPGAAGDLWRPAVTGDGAGGLWVAWSQFAPGEPDGDFDLWAARWHSGVWADPVNLSRAAGNDVDVALATALDGTVYAVWRAYRGPSSDILMATCAAGAWSEPRAVDDSPANEWAPAVAAGPAGVWAAWDSYRFGSYDVFAAPLTRDGPGDVVPLAATARFEAKASVACGPRGEVWVAWQEAGEGWGKDTGYTVPQPQRRQALYQERTVRVACRRGEQWFDAPDVQANVPEGQRRFVEEPRVALDGSGRVWLAYRRPFSAARMRGTQVHQERAWEDHVTVLEGDRWAPERYLPNRLARIDTVPALAPLGADGIAVVFHTDGRSLQRLRGMTRNRIFATRFSAGAPPSAGVPEPRLAPRALAQPVAVGEHEAAQVARCRAYRAPQGDAAAWLLRGDTHRHTEVSWDGNGDGSILDTYRYAMDAAALDFFVVSDHNQQTGVDLPYVRWRCYKLADVMHNPGRFITLFGYERSLGYPNGHRNVLQARRGLPSFPLAGGSDDLPKLYDYARANDSLLIAHTTATHHGTNWYAYDPLLEPVVEIFQGCRLSYEYEGSPKGGAPGDAQAANTGYQPQGFVWRAWQNGRRLGIVASSDHGSTHFSYAGVFAPARTRRGVLAGLSARHTYGATDNLIVDLRAGTRRMGEQWRQGDAPTLDVKVMGTAELAQVDIIRDFQFAYTVDPDGTTFETRWQDNQFSEGQHLYYVRAQQADGSLAWGSPV